MDAKKIFTSTHTVSMWRRAGEFFYFLLAFLFFIEFRERKADVKIRSHSSSGTNVIHEIHPGSLKFEIDFAFFLCGLEKFQWWNISRR